MPRKITKGISKTSSRLLQDIPVPDFLTNNKIVPLRKRKTKKKGKWADAKEAYARWLATPGELREPKTKSEFAKAWKVPADTYLYTWEDDEDVMLKAYNYFNKWLMNIMPDVAYASYQRAIAKVRGSSQDAKLLIDFIDKRVDANRPTGRVQPFFLIGVDQRKIEELFVPTNYVKAAEKSLDFEQRRKARDGEIVTETA